MKAMTFYTVMAATAMSVISGAAWAEGLYGTATNGTSMSTATDADHMSTATGNATSETTGIVKGNGVIKEAPVGDGRFNRGDAYSEPSENKKSSREEEGRRGIDRRGEATVKPGASSSTKVAPDEVGKLPSKQK